MKLIIIALLVTGCSSLRANNNGYVSLATKGQCHDLKAKLYTIAYNDADAFDLVNLNHEGTVKYMCTDLGYSAELDQLCDHAIKACGI